MIRINLLSEKKKKKKIRGAQHLIATSAAIAAAALVLMIAALFYLQYRVSNLKEKAESNKIVIADLNRKINEVKKYEQLNSEIEEKTNIIEVLRKNQSVPVIIMDEVSSLLPQGVWLNSLMYKDGGVTLEGHAFSNLEIVAYVEKLKKSYYLSDVYLEESRQVEVEKVFVYKFKLNFRMKV